MFTLPTFEVPVMKSLPEQAWEAVIAQVKAFQERLPSDMEIGITATNGASVIRVEHVSHESQMLVFDGVDDLGNPARLIQYFSQVNIQVVAVPKLQEKPRRIGF